MTVFKSRSGRFLLAVTLLLLAGTSFLWSCSSAEDVVTGEQAGLSAVAEYTGGPRLHFDSVFIDLGTATPEQSLSTGFRFSNVGDAPLELSPVEKESLEGC